MLSPDVITEWFNFPPNLDTVMFIYLETHALSLEHLLPSIPAPTWGSKTTEMSQGRGG